MSTGEGWLAPLLDSARAKPAHALAELWLRLRDHGWLEDVDRARCEREAESLGMALQKEGPLPLVHPAAAARALDLFLAGADSGHEPRGRKIEVPPDLGGGSVWLEPRRPGWSSRLAARQAGHVEYWVRHYQVVPAVHRRIDISVRQPSALLWKALERRSFGVAVGGFDDGVHPDWTSTSPYSCRRLGDPERRWESVEAVLQAAAEKGAAIVVLPELTVDPAVRQRVRIWLRAEEHPFVLVVAGSFHEPPAEGGAGPGRGLAYAFDALGDVAMSHVKLRPMRKMEDGDPVDEHLTAGRRADLLRTPFGLLGLAICLDFCEIAGAAVADLWPLVGPALMLVPSMGGDSTNNSHRERARVLALQHGTVTAVASQHHREVEAVGFCFLPRATGPAIEIQEQRPMLHTVIRWTAS